MSKSISFTVWGSIKSMSHMLFSGLRKEKVSVKGSFLRIKTLLCNFTPRMMLACECPRRGSLMSLTRARSGWATLRTSVQANGQPERLLFIENVGVVSFPAWRPVTKARLGTLTQLKSHKVKLVDLSCAPTILSDKKQAKPRVLQAKDMSKTA